MGSFICQHAQWHRDHNGITAESGYATLLFRGRPKSQASPQLVLGACRPVLLENHEVSNVYQDISPANNKHNRLGDLIDPRIG